MAHWSVSVARDGENVVTIESNCLSGRELLPGDEEVIRGCALNLLGFIGDPRPVDLGPHPNCARCGGSGEEPNAQFRCACRWSTGPVRAKAEGR